MLKLYLSGSVRKSVLIIMLVFLFVCQAVSAENLMITYSDDYKKNILVEKVRTISLPKGYHEDLYLDGEKILISNGNDINTWVMDIGTGVLLSEIEPIGEFTEAMIPVGDIFWVTDWEDKKVYRVKIDDNKMYSEDERSLAPAHPAGMIQVREKVYIIIWTRSINGTKCHLVEFDLDGNVLRKIQITKILEPSQMTWDGSYLYITSWFSNIVYRIDVNVWKITASFKSPAKKTSGIAYDGSHFWITGTYDDLYKIKILED